MIWESNADFLFGLYFWSLLIMYIIIDQWKRKFMVQINNLRRWIKKVFKIKWLNTAMDDKRQ